MKAAARFRKMTKGKAHWVWAFLTLLIGIFLFASLASAACPQSPANYVC